MMVSHFRQWKAILLMLFMVKKVGDVIFRSMFIDLGHSGLGWRVCGDRR